MSKKGRRSRKAKQGQKQRGGRDYMVPSSSRSVGRVAKSMLRGQDRISAQSEVSGTQDPLSTNPWCRDFTRPFKEVMEEGVSSGKALIHSEGAYCPMKIKQDQIPSMMESVAEDGVVAPPGLESFLRSMGPDGFPATEVAGMKLRAKDANSTLTAMTMGLGYYASGKQKYLDAEIAQAIKALEESTSEVSALRAKELKEWLFAGRCNLLGHTGAVTACGLDKHEGTIDDFLQGLGTLGMANRANEKQGAIDDSGGVPASDPSSFGVSYKIDLNGTAFSKVNPDYCGPRFDSMSITPSTGPLGPGDYVRSPAKLGSYLGAGVKGATEEFSVSQLRPIPYRAPPEFDGYDTFINILNHHPEQIAPPGHTIHHLLAQAERFVYVQSPEDFLPEAFDGERYTPAYLECMAEAKEREAGGFYMPFEVCCFEDSSSFMAIVGGGNRRGLYDFRYFVDIQPLCPILSTPSYNSSMMKYLNKTNTKINEWPTKGDAVVRVGMIGNIGQFVGGKICANVVVFREFSVSRKGRVELDYQNSTQGLFAEHGRYDLTCLAMGNNVLTTIEEVMYLNNQGVTPTQYQRCTSTPVNPGPPRNSKKGRKKRAHKKRSTTIMIEPGTFERSARSPHGGGGGEGTTKLRKYHHRRGCEVTLSHARFARSGKQGKTVWRRPCWVGETEGVITDLCPTLKGDRLYVIDTKGRPDHRLEEE